MFLKDPKAIAFLKKEHRAVDELFAKYEGLEEAKEKVDTVQEICQSLMMHAHIEEQIFYPALRGKVKDKLLDEAFVEHDTLKDLIAKIDGSGPDDQFFDAHVRVLKEYVHHHVKEEEGEIMPAAQDTDLDLEAMGDRLEDLRTRLENELATETPPAGAEHQQVEVMQMDGRSIRHH